jgi:hypothetical protein
MHHIQGYATGDLEQDAFAVRYFANERGFELMVTQVPFLLMTSFPAHDFLSYS